MSAQRANLRTPWPGGRPATHKDPHSPRGRRDHTRSTQCSWSQEGTSTRAIWRPCRYQVSTHIGNLSPTQSGATTQRVTGNTMPVISEMEIERCEIHSRAGDRACALDVRDGHLALCD